MVAVREKSWKRVGFTLAYLVVATVGAADFVLTATMNAGYFRVQGYGPRRSVTSPTTLPCPDVCG